MKRILIGATALCALVSMGALSAHAEDNAQASVAHGKQLFAAIGCYQCHGYQGQGGTGPKLAPGMLPYDAFEHQLRDPRAVMPIYTEVVMPESDVKDVYAYLQSQPKVRAVADIPLLH